MANVGGPHNNQPQPHLQAFKDAADGARNNTQIKVDSNTGNVGTRSLFGRAWRAVTPNSSERRASNRSDINGFKDALLRQNNEESKVGKVLNKFLPGHEGGKVPLTAGAVRDSIEYLNMLKMPIESAVDNSQFQDFAVKQRADENLNFYLEARDILGDGADIIDVQMFNDLVGRYVDPRQQQEQVKINIPGPLEQEMIQFVANNNVHKYNDQQSKGARQLLQKVQTLLREEMSAGPLMNFQFTLKNQLDQR